MNFLKITTASLIILLTYKMNAQDLSSHRWKDRLLLVLTNNINDTVYQEQLIAFQQEEQGMKERQLIVYHITPNKFCTGMNGDGPWQASALYRSYKQTDGPFEIVLIGLDGGVKWRQTELLPCDKLFSIIDGMPMRRAEIQNKKN